MFYALGIRKEAKIHPFRSSLKSVCKLIKWFKKHMHSNFVNVMKDKLFGVNFMVFYNEEFEKDKGMNPYEVFWKEW